MANNTKNIMIVGVGGQGTLLTSRILGGITVDAGFDVKLSEVHGMAQRGGSVVTFVRYGEKVAEPIVEEGQADVLIAFERLEALRYAHFLKKDGVFNYDKKRTYKILFRRTSRYCRRKQRKSLRHNGRICRKAS